MQCQIFNYGILTKINSFVSFFCQYIDIVIYCSMVIVFNVESMVSCLFTFREYYKKVLNEVMAQDSKYRGRREEFNYEGNSGFQH